MCGFPSFLWVRISSSCTLPQRVKRTVGNLIPNSKQVFSWDNRKCYPTTGGDVHCPQVINVDTVIKMH